MFKNPLKYQQGGAAPSQQEQQVLAAFIQWLPKRVKEFQGMQPEQIAQAVEGMSKTEEGKKQLQQLMIQFQQETQNGSQAFKEGGKIHDFICKHAKGGYVAGCGCSGQVEKHQDANGVIGINHSPKNERIKISPIVNLLSYINGKRTPDVGDAKNRSFGYTRLNGNQYFRESADVNGNSAETWVQVTPQKDTLVDQTLSNRNALYPDQVETIMKRMRPDIKKVPAKKQQGGNIFMAQNGGLTRASAYYAKHANEGIIRKLQNFLASRGYNVGDLDGKFGQRTYNAIRQYQRDNGLVDDGMWGEDTNQVHRVLGAGDTTFNGSRSGAHPGKHTYTSGFKGQRSYATPEQEDAYLRQITNRAYNDANWFWGDTADANAARDFLYRRNGGNEFIQDIYENYTSPELQQKIAYSKLPVNIQQRRYNQGISTAMDNAGQTGAKIGAVIGGTMLAAEAIPYLVEAGPEIANGLKGVWNPAQARTGTFFHRIPNGSMVNNATGQFVSNAGMNLGQFTSGTDYAATMANNLRMITPYGFKKGGKIEKAQEGTILDYYRNKWDNDWNRIKTGWNNFKNSAPGKVWGAFIPNPNSESGMLGAAAPVGKISSLGKAASKLDDEVKVLGYYDELGNFIKTEGDDVIRNAGDYMNKTKWPEFEMPEYNQPNFIETDYSGIDFNNITMPHANLEDWLIGGGITAALGGAAYAGAKMAESETKNKKENKSGSKSAEKKQSGGLIDFYKNKWGNDFFE